MAKDAEPPPPQFLRPQLSHFVETPPSGPNWAHELKYNGYRIHARLARREARLLTRTGLDWTDRMRRQQRRFLRLPFNLSISMVNCVRFVQMAPHPFPRCRPRPTRDGRSTLYTS